MKRKSYITLAPFSNPLFLMICLFGCWALAPPLRAEETQLRKFLYQSSDGSWFLSDMPNLKSCCVESEKKKGETILVIGDIDSKWNQRAATIKGNLIQAPNGTLRLEDPEFISSTKHFPVSYLLLIPIGAWVILRFRKKTFQMS